MNLDYGAFRKLVEEKKARLYKSAKRSLNSRDIKRLDLACEVAEFSHFSQNRKSGEPYIIHPFEVATIIADWDLDCTTICSSILHDVVEDTSVTKEDIGQIFGSEIAELVDSLTKLEKINFETDELADAEYFRKVVLAMAKDIRVILIKLADRLHNILTLSSLKKEKQNKIALETMEIYVPIANRIGLHRVHLQLAEESFKYLNPFRYKVLQKAVQNAQNNRKPIIESILHNIRGSMESNGINATFVSNQRPIFNIYRRMRRRNMSFDRIYDIFEIKIIVENIRECYLTLGILHILYQPLPGKFKDYIAIPKSNGYQSLHSTLMGPHGIPLQIHIRTKAMEEVAENGIICHWIKNKNNDDFLSANKRTANWINNILDIQSSTFSADEFLSNLKHDLLPVDIYVFSPKGKIIILPHGATPIDFAYFIHSDVGNHCFQAKVNSKLSKLDTKLQSGDIVEIITDINTEPSHKWLEIARSGKAISKIKQYFKEQKYDEDISNGIKLINYSIEALGHHTRITLTKLESIVRIFYPKLTTDELEHSIGTGNISPLNVAQKILGISSNASIQINLSNCKHLSVVQDDNCLALPGDDIMARISRDGELIIHKMKCKQNRQVGLDNLTFIHIINDVHRQFLTKIKAILYNIPGTFTKFSGIIADREINIIKLHQEISTEKFAVVEATLGVLDKNQLDDLCSSLSETDFVDKIYLDW